MCLFGELVNWRHPWVVQGKGELGSLGLHLSLNGIQGEVMLQDHPRNVQSEGRTILSRGHYGP